jgi:D-3-phosphoglycerate dehydrogenase
MKIKVSNRAFSNNKYLVDCLLAEFPDAVVNAEGILYNNEALIEYFSDADAAIVGLELITADLLDKLPKLKMIAKYGVGLDNIDIEACAQRNINVGWTGGVNKRSVAEMALGFMLALCRNLFITSNQLKSGNWNKSGGIELSGRTVGIIGLGNIGKELVSLLQPFGCRILVNDVIDIHAEIKEHGLIQASKEEIYKNADIITIHTPLTSETTNLIDKSAFEMMKSTSFLINTSRGGVVRESDLKFALENGLIAGAALDVYENEPPTDLTLLSIPNLICTPHTGGNSNQAVVAMGLSALNHIIKFRDKNNLQ